MSQDLEILQSNETHSIVSVYFLKCVLLFWTIVLVCGWKKNVGSMLGRKPNCCQERGPPSPQSLAATAWSRVLSLCWEFFQSCLYERCIVPSWTAATLYAGLWKDFIKWRKQKASVYLRSFFISFFFLSICMQKRKKEQPSGLLKECHNVLGDKDKKKRSYKQILPTWRQGHK